ncbi:MAG: hypothetical protein OZ921_10710 [Sorangiineae bacterium]|nr:hypothetical protein [Polyangiaceae bacterium]MEB2322979.1 hypothetical protein [Sorangiineae bacterium]
MAEPAKSKKKGKKKAPLERKERRFLPKQTQTSVLAVGGGMLGALVLGAGVYDQWLSDAPHSYARWIVTAGVIGLGVALWFGDAGAHPVRVGDVGLAVDKGDQIVRLAWCDIERIGVDQGQLVAKGTSGVTLAVPLRMHPVAAAWILSEGARRIPRAMDVKTSVVEGLPKPAATDGEVRTIDDYQVAGRECAASGELITLERDARLCPNCAQIYHKDHAPRKCVTCGEPLAPAER